MSNTYPSIKRLQLIRDLGLNKYKTKKEFISHLEYRGYSISSRTLNRDFTQLNELGYDVYYDSHLQKHMITDSLIDKQTLVDRLVELESIKNFEKDYSKFYEQYVIDGESNSEGIELIRPLFEAIDEKLILTFDYHKFDFTSSTREIYPLQLKLSQHRWYILGHDTQKNALRIFGLDRIKSLKTKGVFDIKRIPQHTLTELKLQKFYYGISGHIFKEKKKQRIVLEVSKHLINYWKSKPIHFTQEIIGKTDDADYLVELILVPNIDLVKLILSSLGEIKVVEPVALKKYIRDNYKDFLKEFM